MRDRAKPMKRFLRNAIGFKEFRADVTFTVHFALTEGQRTYRLALFMETPDYPQGEGASRHLLWEGEVTLRTPKVVPEQPVHVTTRFHGPGNIALRSTPVPASPHPIPSTALAGPVSPA